MDRQSGADADERRSALAPVQFTLSNGLRVIVQTKTDRPTFILQGGIASSPGFEPPGKEGIARLAGAVADYGSASYPFAQRARRPTRWARSSTPVQDSRARGTSGDFERIVAILATASGIRPLPIVVATRALAARQQPSIRIEHLRRDDQSGVLSALARRRRPDAARSDLANHHRHFAGRPRRVCAAFLAAGSHDDRSRRESFAATGARRARIGLRLVAGWRTEAGSSAYGDAARGERARVHRNGGQSSLHSSRPARAIALEFRLQYLSVLNQILGGSGDFESRLWQELRQKRGLVYSVSSELDSDTDRGDFRIELSASPERVVEAVAFVRQELERLQNAPVSQTELDEAKVRLVSDALLDEASSSGQAKQLMDIATNGLPLNYYSVFSERFARITPTTSSASRESTCTLAASWKSTPARRFCGRSTRYDRDDRSHHRTRLEHFALMDAGAIKAKLEAAARAQTRWAPTTFERARDGAARRRPRTCARSAIAWRRRRCERWASRSCRPARR